MKSISSLLIVILIFCAISSSEAQTVVINKLVAIVTYILDHYNININPVLDNDECIKINEKMFNILKLSRKHATNQFCDETKTQISLPDLIITFRTSLTAVLNLEGQTDNHLIQGLIDAFYSRWAHTNGLKERQFIIVMNDLYELLKLEPCVKQFISAFQVTSITNSEFMEVNEFFVFVDHFLGVTIPNFI